jgi:hypothetical protein
MDLVRTAGTTNVIVIAMRRVCKKCDVHMGSKFRENSFGLPGKTADKAGGISLATTDRKCRKLFRLREEVNGFRITLENDTVSACRKIWRECVTNDTVKARIEKYNK